MEPIRPFESKIVVLPVENIDTDQIIPARFLKVTDRAGLGEALFADWRYDGAGRPNEDFILNRPGARGAEILVAGDNFGCGSSREHASWALLGYGFRAVISTSFGDIFRNNALKNGLLPVVLPEPVVQMLMRRPDDELEIDIATRELRTPDRQVFHFPLDDFARTCLLEGVDELGWLLARENEIRLYEERFHAR